MENLSNREELVYTIAELSAVMKIGTNRALDLVKTPGFPSFRNGRKYLIPKEPLLKWLEEQAKGENK